MKKIIPIILVLLFLPAVCWGAITEGTNAGFVTVAPTTDPEGTAELDINNLSRSAKFTAPAGAITITEIGWYCTWDPPFNGNWEAGVYSDDGNGATSLPVNLLYVSRTNATGTTHGWLRSTVNFSITAGTIYWLAIQLDTLSTTMPIDGATGGSRRSYMNAPQLTLANPWVSNGVSDNILAIYAVYTTGGVSRRMWIF